MIAPLIFRSVFCLCVTSVLKLKRKTLTGAVAVGTPGTVHAPREKGRRSPTLAVVRPPTETLSAEGNGQIGEEFVVPTSNSGRPSP